LAVAASEEGVMPELIVARNPIVGRAVAATVMALDRRQQSPTTMTLLNNDQLRIGDDDPRHIIGTCEMNGVTTYTVDLGRLTNGQRCQRAELARVKVAIDHLATVCRPIAHRSDCMIEALGLLFNWYHDQAARGHRLYRRADRGPQARAGARHSSAQEGTSRQSAFGTADGSGSRASNAGG
jgi:hypothetical protein